MLKAALNGEQRFYRISGYVLAEMQGKKNPVR